MPVENTFLTRFHNEFIFDGVLCKCIRGHGGGIRTATDDDLIEFIANERALAIEEGERNIKDNVETMIAICDDYLVFQEEFYKL